MEAAEIIAARVAFERATWGIFGETLLRMPDMREARETFNKRVGALYSALPAEVASTLKEWQKPLSV